MTVDQLLSIINEKGITVRNQSYVLHLEPLPIPDMLTELIKSYGDVKTILCLKELLNPSVNTRSKNIPRQQNSWMLFRRDISHGLYKANNYNSVNSTSKAASDLWKKLTDHEKKFWKELSKIAKVKHQVTFPEYKFMPIKRNEKNTFKYKGKSVESYTNSQLYKHYYSYNVNSMLLSIEHQNYLNQGVMCNTDVNFDNFDYFDYSECLIDPALYQEL